jgi:hypothetical protein
MRTNTTATTATASWTIYRWGWQFTGSQGFDDAYVPFFGTFGAAWEDGMVAPEHQSAWDALTGHGGARSGSNTPSTRPASRSPTRR